MNVPTYRLSDSRISIQPDELEAGLVLFLEPTVLQLRGASNSVEYRSYEVAGTHPFLCCRKLDDVGLWMPIFSRPGADRILIPRDEKRGHAQWRARRSYFHPGQRWTIRTSIVLEAAEAAREKSSPGFRNRVCCEWLEQQLRSTEVPAASVCGRKASRR